MTVETVALTPFDLLGDLPSGTTVLEASAGTGKTYTIAGLVTRYVVEGKAVMEDLLVITFGRMASQELRERVRGQLVAAERALADDAAEPADELLRLLVQVDGDERRERRRRVVTALASFDAATIATTHQFCHVVLRSLGVAGDEDARAALVEDLSDLVEEVVDDLYLRRFGEEERIPFDRRTALQLGLAAVGDPLAEPIVREDGARERLEFVRDVVAEVERRKRLRGVLSYDDLLTRLAHALEAEDAPARERMRQRWRIVLVDEFQDTDPVQWQVIERGFLGHATVVLIGDPKQAIYAFRGGDVVTYLRARGSALTVQTLPTNHRSDEGLVGSLQVLTRDVPLGHPDISVHPVGARHGCRLTGDAHQVQAPVRLRVLRRRDFGVREDKNIPIEPARQHIAADLADDVARLLDSGATYQAEVPRPVRAGDVAILLYSVYEAPQFQAELASRGIPSVVTGTRNVVSTPAGDEWLALLEALEAPHHTARIRALALTSFVGHTAAELDAEGDDLTDDLAERVRSWLDLLRHRGIAAVYESMAADGLAARVLGWQGGERLLTDLQHIAQVLHDVSHRDRLGLAGLLEWLRAERRADERNAERARRLDTDAHAVQIVTYHGSKGLQYPVVYLPLLFDRGIRRRPTHLYHDDSGRRVLDLTGGPDQPPEAEAELLGEELRMAYVALTRAQCQLVLWYAPTYNSRNSGLSRLLVREPGSTGVADPAAAPPEGDLAARLKAWEALGAFRLELSVLEETDLSVTPPAVGDLSARAFDRQLDLAWRRTSYSGIIRGEAQRAAAVSEPEATGTVDEDLPEEEVDGPVGAARPDLPAPLSPMEGLPAGATFGSLVHAVLEHADPEQPDLLAEVRRHVVEQQQWWSVDADADELAEALLPMQHTALGPLADDLRLVDVPLRDRLRELDFEFPLAGGDLGDGGRVTVADIAAALRRHLPVEDPMRAYADRLDTSLSDQVLRGYLSGSIDVVLRVPDATVPGGMRFVVADYKTNRLGTPGEPLTALDYTPAAMTAAMLHSHYPLQALLYSVVLHRYLRWRLPGYDPALHLGGILYLYVRGMCGPETPVVDGLPCGVFTWQPTAELVVALSDLLAGETP